MARLGAVAVGAAVVAARVAYVLHHRVNSDEPQHLHVAWAWTQHLLPYRDVFDNHSPLFGMVFSSVVAVVGERPDIVLAARLAMIPLVALTLAATWLVARRLFSSRAAWWAVAFAATIPDFLLGSVEFRTDQLWTALWLATLAVLVTGRESRGRALAVGLLAGATFAASMKTSLLLVSLALAGLVTCGLLWRRGMAPGWRRVLPRVGLATAGLAVVPGLLAWFFAARGALGPMLYGMVGHNLVPGLGLWTKAPHRVGLLWIGLAMAWPLGAAMVDRSPEPRTGAWRAVLLLTAGFYGAGLEGFWPLVTRQDLLPFVPMASVFLAPLVLACTESAARRARGPALRWAVGLAPSMVVVVAIGWAAAIEPPWSDHTRPETTFLTQALRLTHPGDSVMDLRGETVFRDRPYFYALEEITRARIRKGMIPDDIARHLVAARTPVAVEDTDEFPPAARAFMNANYVPVGGLRVAGKILEPGPGEPEAVRSFDLRLPQSYALVSRQGPARGWLDGAVYRGPRALASGPHDYRPAAGEGPVAVVWAAALDRGFSPFRP